MESHQFLTVIDIIEGLLEDDAVTAIEQYMGSLSDISEMDNDVIQSYDYAFKTMDGKAISAFLIGMFALFDKISFNQDGGIRAKLYDTLKAKSKVVTNVDNSYWIDIFDDDATMDKLIEIYEYDV